MQIQLPGDARIEEKKDGIWLIVPNAAIKLHGPPLVEKALRTWFDKASSPTIAEATEVAAALERLRAKGYKVALEDGRWRIDDGSFTESQLVEFEKTVG